MSRKYPPHGHSSVRIEDGILISEVTGPFNMELARSWTEAMYPLAEKLKLTGQAAAITVYRNSFLTQPDVLDYMKNAIRFAAQHQEFVAYALVVGADVEGHALADLIYRGVYEQYGTYRFFTDYEPAKVWVRATLNAHQRAGNA